MRGRKPPRVGRSTELRAARSVPAPPERVFEFIRALDRHWELMRGRVEALSTAGGGDSCIRLRGPLGIRRTAWARLSYARPSESLVGRVKVGGLTRGTVRWSIQRSDGGSWTEVTIRASALSPFDRLLLAFGGRRWLARSLEAALDSLSERLAES